jgi:acetylglutamate kinase
MTPGRSAQDHTREIITQLLSNMGGAREIRQYLKKYSGGDGNNFAVVKVGGAVVRDELDVLASALSFLKTVGLMPIVIHGAGPQLDAAQEAEGVVTTRCDGLRVTSADVLALARRSFRDVNLAIVKALGDLGVGATSITGGVFAADILDQQRYGYVGEIRSVDMTAVQASLAAGRVPVILPLGETDGGQILNVNSDTATHHFIRAAQPNKIIFLTATGGLLDGAGERIEAINLATAYDDLMAAEWLQGGMRLKMQEIAGMLDDLPLSASVSITSPAELAKELFTHTGSGTLVRRGEKIIEFRSWDDVDKGRLAALVESAFGRPLADNYFDVTDLECAYIIDSYRAAAIMTRQGDISSLDKFAVEDAARGEGLGRTIWQRMIDDHPRLVWRSRVENPVSNFYFTESDGCVKSGPWRVFWRGLEDPAEINAAVEATLARPLTITDANTESVEE